jgi:hypothetical protein
MKINSNADSLEFLSVTGSDKHVDALYSLLVQRRHSISHKEMPSPQQHRQFVLSHPYRAWYLIKRGTEFVGSIYLTEQNTIGVSAPATGTVVIAAAVKYITSHHKPLPPVPSIRPGDFHVNVAIADTRLRRVLRQIGANAVQTTYRLTTANDV